MNFSPFIERLREVCGEKIFWQVLEEFGGNVIYIPSRYDSRRGARFLERNLEITRDCKELVEKYPDISESILFTPLAKEYKLSVRRIAQIYAEFKDNEEIIRKENQNITDNINKY